MPFSYACTLLHILLTETSVPFTESFTETACSVGMSMLCSPPPFFLHSLSYFLSSMLFFM